jgi:uncharacterized protein (UPF0276 family)
MPPTGLLSGVGLGLKPEHFQQVLATRPALGFFEVHAENYMVAGGPFLHYLDRIRADYPISMHGVGLSIGAEGGLDEAHLARLAQLIERVEPACFSEHLAWSSQGGQDGASPGGASHYLADLLPLPWNEATLDRVCRHVDQVQHRMRRRMLLENPATYLEFEASTMDEAGFLAEVLRRTGCGLLLDLSNVHVSCTNHGRDARAYLAALPLAAVGELHLAGFATDQDAAGALLLIDSHGSPVDEAVWRLYAEVLGRIGPVPTLIERDNDVPAFDVLLAEAAQAAAILEAA